MPDTVPSPGFGTYDLHGEAGVRVVRHAIEAGYRHVDTARMYDNEAVVGEALARADVPRGDAFVATKVGHFTEPDLTPAYIRSSVRESLDALGVDAVDLLYVHWPYSFDAEVHVPVLEGLVADGLVRHLGVSNFTPDLLEGTLAVADGPLLANQVELHPLLPQPDLLAAADAHDVTLVAYSPLAQGLVTEVPEIRAVAEDRGATPAQVSLAWVRAKGAVPIPKTASPERAEENLAAADLDLTADEVARIDGIERRTRLEDEPFMDW